MQMTIIVAVILTALVWSYTATGATRCRTTTSGSTTYTTCEGDVKTRCRTYKAGSTTYTRCS